VLVKSYPITIDGVTYPSLRQYVFSKLAEGTDIHDIIESICKANPTLRRFYVQCHCYKYRKQYLDNLTKVHKKMLEGELHEKLTKVQNSIAFI
jgi:hypothetical protein